MSTRGWLVVCLSLAFLDLLGGCDSSTSQPPPAPTLAKELVLYNWVDDMPRSVLDAFTGEYGVRIKEVTFESQEEAVEHLANNQVYDVAVIENPFIPALTADNKLARIDFRHLPNFKNISANFRDLAADPGNQFTVPYHYGTTGLLVRTDLIDRPVTSWGDLWQPHSAGRVAVRAQPRELLALTLLSLGYSLNSEDPKEIEAATERLLQLKKAAVLVEVDTPKAVADLLSGKVVMLLGWPMDYQFAHAANPKVAYVLPREGTALWSDNYVIPASSSRKYTAEVFINFLLRPEISARIVNEKKYPNANEAALPLIDPEIRHDPVTSPTPETLRAAHFYLPLSPRGTGLYQRAWDRFLAAPPANGGRHE